MVRGLRVGIQESLVRTAEVEHALVRIACDEGPGPRHHEALDQPGGGRVQVVRIVDQQQLHLLPLPLDQLLALRLLKGGQGRVQQLGSVQALRAAQALDLLVFLLELPRSLPHRAVVFDP